MLRFIKGKTIDASLSVAFGEGIIDRGEVVDLLRRSERLICVTDFSAATLKGVGLETVGVLVCPIDSYFKWHHTHRREFRSGGLRTNDSIAFKKISDRRSDTIEWLHQYLRRLNNLPGLLCTLSVPTDPRFCFTNKDDVATDSHLSDYSDWNPKTFERLVRIATAICTVISPWYLQGQEVYWICDNDQINETEEKRELSNRFVSAWANRTIGMPLPIATTLPNEIRDKLAISDTLAIPDLAAGGIAISIADEYVEVGQVTVDKWTIGIADQHRKAQEISLWFADSVGSLVKTALTLDGKRGKAYRHLFIQAPRDLSHFAYEHWSPQDPAGMPRRTDNGH